jgi:hypothetical protein
MSSLQATSTVSARAISAGSHWLTHHWSVPALALLGMLMVLPVMNSGLILDDFLHWSTLHEGARVANHAGSPWGLFHFLAGNATENQALKATGEMVWWAADDLRTLFWRPLTEWTHWLDHALWPHSPALMHLHSMLWYGALIFLLARLYQRIDTSSPVRARLAVLFFVCSILHLTAVAWIAARNQLVAACCTVLCIGAFHVWRTRPSPRHGWLAVAMFGLALMSAEAGLATLGYLVAHVLVFGAPHQPNQAGNFWRERVAPLLPFLVIMVIWRVAYNALGYGSSGSGFYIDPASDPVRFAGNILLRLPTLLLAQVVGVPSATLNLLTPAQQAMYAAAAAGTLALCWSVARVYGLWTNPVARFLGIGGVLALVPMCASETTDRLLLNAEIGFSWLLALLFTRALGQHRPRRSWVTLPAKILIGLIVFVHLVVMPIQTVAYAALRKPLLSPTAVLDPLGLPDGRQDPNARVVLLNPPMASLNFYYPSVRRYHGMLNPASMHALANSFHELSLTVLDAHTLELRSAGNRSFIDSFSRDVVTRPFKIGEVIQAGPLQAVVTTLSPLGTPQSVRFHFRSPITSSPWRFYVWSDAGYVPYTLPAPGHTASLPAPDLGRAVLRQLKGEERRQAWR